MVLHDFRSGGGKGYVPGFCSLLKDFVVPSDVSEVDDMDEVDVEYSKPVAS